MGRWAARYAEKLATPLKGCTDKTDERGFLSVMAVPRQGGEGETLPVPAAQAGDAAAPDPAPVIRMDGETARAQSRRARLLRWGWPEADAEAVAARLARRDREADPRVSCTDCRHYRPGRCGNHWRAGLGSPEIGRDLAALLQRCPGFDCER